MIKDKMKPHTAFAILGAAVGILLLLWGSFGFPENEDKALKLMSSIFVAPPAAPSMKNKVAGALRSVVGDSGVKTIKNIIGKK